MASNYIVTTKQNNEDDLFHLKLMTWHDLYTANFAFNSPFQLRLENQTILFALSVIRILPKHRIVVFGHWQGKTVIAKLFFHPRRANQHLKQDVTGIKLLHDNNIPCPSIDYQGTGEDKRIAVVLFEKISHAISLQELMRSVKTEDEKLNILQAVILELATQHVFGIVQKDLHLNNFLLTDKTIYTLDGAQIVQYPHLLSKKNSMYNLALFFSQLPINNKQQALLFRLYASYRGWLIKECDIIELFFMIKKRQEKRWQDFEKKLLRACSQFRPLKKWFTRGMLDRSYQGHELSAFLDNPDAIFNQPGINILKAGRSSTVIQVQLDGKNFVIKRYNLKSITHRMRRLFRPTRALRAWKLSQKLAFFNIATAKPVAFIEHQFLKMRGKSYFVTEYISNQHIGDFFNQTPSFETNSKVVNNTIELLKQLAQIGLTHGDLKATNILLNENHQPFLIDLDGATSYISLDNLQVAWKKEISRLLENFTCRPDIVEMIKKRWEAKNIDV